MLLAETGGRVQALSRQYAGAQPFALVLAALLLSSLISLGIAAAGAVWISAMIGERPRLLLAGLALLLAGLPMLLKAKPPKPIPEKPGVTTSLFAFIAAQIGDASQFIVFALATRGNSVALSLAGGLAAVLLAGALPSLLGKDWPEAEGLEVFRRIAAILLTVTGLAMGLSALGWFGG